MDAQVVQVDGGHAVVAGFDADGAGVVGRNAGDGVQVDAGGQAVAQLVVGVAAAQLGPSGRGEEQRLAVGGAGENLREFLRQLQQADGGGVRVRAVDAGQGLPRRAAVQIFQ